MQTLILFLLATLAAVVVPFQSIVNGRLGQLVGNPFFAGFISFLGGTLALAVLTLVSAGGIPRIPAGVTIPWYLCTGGMLGVVFVTIVLVIVPKLGTANVLAATITGQLVTSLIVDHFGIVGMPKLPITGARVAGLLILLLGTWLISRG